MELFSVREAIISSASSTQSVALGVVQEVSFDFSADIKELHGQSKYALMAVQGSGSVTGKASYARFNAETLAVFLGATSAAGATLLGSTGGVGQTPQAIPTTPFEVTPTPANSGTFAADKGVILVGASELYNTQMTRVTGTPTTGQYAEAAGVYTFAAADAGTYVIITYTYTTASGKVITVPNTALGATYPFELIARTTLESKDCMIRFPNVISGKLGLPLKTGEFTMSDVDMTAFSDGLGNIAYINLI